MGPQLYTRIQCYQTIMPLKLTAKIVTMAYSNSLIRGGMGLKPRLRPSHQPSTTVSEPSVSQADNIFRISGNVDKTWNKQGSGTFLRNDEVELWVSLLECGAILAVYTLSKLQACKLLSTHVCLNLIDYFSISNSRSSWVLQSC